MNEKREVKEVREIIKDIRKDKRAMKKIKEMLKKTRLEDEFNR